MTLFANIFRKDIAHFKDIDDLPVWNWFKINETDDLTFLLVEQRTTSAKEKDYLRRVFEKIYENFINTFGINEMLKRVLELRRDIAVLKLEMAIHNDGSRQTFIDIKEQEFKGILLEAEKEKNTTIKAYLDKYMGFRIDEKTVSVKDYYGYLALLKDESESTKKADGRQN
jgi:hypothetical protein